MLKEKQRDKIKELYSKSWHENGQPYQKENTLAEQKRDKIRLTFFFQKKMIFIYIGISSC
jgi:hypothetical protein